MRAFAAVTLAVCAAVCFAASPARSAAPAAKPTPTPTPVAIGYDEVSRMVMPPGTPPPPGSFQNDYQLALQGTSTVAAASGATPTPAPKRHGFGGLLNAVANPMGNQGEAGPENAGPGGPPPGMGQGQAMMNMMQYGHVVRYTFYWTKNWEREDDPIAHTAVITKCPQHQIIRLDLTAKTYTIEDTSSHPCTETPTMGVPGGRGRSSTMGPGTVDMTVTSNNQDLGPKTLEGIATTGDRRTMSMSMTNATGSCTNGSFNMLTVAYISGIHKQRAYCPLSLPVMPATTAGGGGSSGGCKPTFHGSMSGNPMAGSDMLEMYLLTQTGMGADGGGRTFAQLLERGNVDWYLKPQADALFTWPPDFTKAG
jgi:hypothetical protein